MKQKPLSFFVALMAWVSIFVIKGLEVADLIELNTDDIWYLGFCLAMALISGVIFIDDGRSF